MNKVERYLKNLCSLSTGEGILCVQCQANAEKVLGSAQAVRLTLNKCQSLCYAYGSIGISRVDIRRAGISLTAFDK